MRTNKILTMVGSAVVVVASGGGIHDALAGIHAGGAPATSKGTVSQFGSIYVNGVRYVTDQAVFLIDGELGYETDLHVGQVVTVFGSIDAGGTTGIADLVIYEDAVEGPVTGVDPLLNQFTVLGQTVVVSDDTSYSIGENVDSLSDLRDDDVVEVSGHVNAEGVIVATHIGSAAANDGFDVTGTVISVSSDSYRLTIGGLTVDFSAANVYGLPGGIPEVGQQIEVTGSYASGEFVATTVSDAPQAISAFAGDEVEIEGLVTDYVSPWNFEVDGVPVAISWGTRFEGGWLFHIRPNAKLEVEGYMASDGRLIADTVEFERTASSRMEGHVESVIGNELVVGGVSVRVSPETEFEDYGDDDEHRFGIDDLRTGDYIRVRSYNDDGETIATRLERRDSSDDDDGGDDD